MKNERSLILRKTKNLGHPIPIRLSIRTHDSVTDAAIRADLTISSYVRSIIGQHLHLTDPEDLQPVRRYGGGAPDLAALTALRMQLHQLGGLLTQVAKVSRTEGNASLHADAEGTLAEIREAIAIIAVWQEERRKGVG